MCRSLPRKSSSIRFRRGLEQAFVSYGTHAGWGTLPWQERGKKHVLSEIYHLAREVFWAILRKPATTNDAKIHSSFWNHRSTRWRPRFARRESFTHWNFLWCEHFSVCSLCGSTVRCCSSFCRTPVRGCPRGLSSLAS
jgi:hypothetical protein